MALVFVLGFFLVTSARAESPYGETFGPVITVEDIEIRGNTATKADVILQALPVVKGDVLQAGSSALVTARYRLLALGFFRKVELFFAKGRTRGHVVLVVDVVERGTLVLNRIHFGTTGATPWWLGLDLGDRNFLGSGLHVSGAFAVAGQGNIAGAQDQSSVQLRISDSAFFASRFGWRATAYWIRGSEPYRTAGDFSDSSVEHFSAFGFRRIGGQVGVSRRLTSLSRVDVGSRYEAVRGRVPENPMYVHVDGASEKIDLHLHDGASRVVTVSASYDRDTRPDPVLPWTGDRMLGHWEVGHGAFGGDYDFLTALARYQHWWSVHSKRHVVSLHLTGGLVFGDAPRFDRIYMGDLNRMVTPRILGLVMSTASPFDVFGTGSDEVTYGELAVATEVQYAHNLFRRRGYVYGGELYVGAGLWSLSNLADPGATRVDILLDAGLRLDTEVGIFEISLANALGRLPL